MTALSLDSSSFAKHVRLAVVVWRAFSALEIIHITDMFTDVIIIRSDDVLVEQELNNSAVLGRISLHQHSKLHIEKEHDQHAISPYIIYTPPSKQVMRI